MRIMASTSKEENSDHKFIVGIESPADRKEKALWFIFRGREILIKSHKNPGAIPKHLDFGELGLSSIRGQYLGTLEGIHCYSVEVPEDTPAPEEMKFVDLRQAYSEMSEGCFALLTYSPTLKLWGFYC
jgi:NAD+ diphosphatase